MHIIGSDAETLKNMIGRLRAQLDPLEAAYAAMTGDAAQPVDSTPHVPQNGHMDIQPDTFERMELRDAIEKFFLMNGGRPAHRLNEILPALQAGGARLGIKERQDRHLKIAIRTNAKNNKHLFIYDDKTEMVQLRHPLKINKAS